MLNFISEMHPVSIAAVSLLGIYFFAINWIFFYRLLFLNNWASQESSSLESLLLGSDSVAMHSYLHKFLVNRSLNGALLKLSEISATKEATRFLSFLSIVASTAPFIGLFGTVVSLLGTFSELAATSTGTLGIVTAGVGDALVATAVGIFVATFAYTYQQILKRKAYNTVELIRMQGEALQSKKTE